MNTAAARPLRSRRHLKTLRLRKAAQLAELATCTTPAMVLCVLQAIADTDRQLMEAR